MTKAAYKKTFNQANSKKIKNMYLSGLEIPQIIKEVGISMATFYRYKSEWNLSRINIAVESTQGRYQKNYNNISKLCTNIERFELSLIRRLSLSTDSEIKFWPYSFKNIVHNELHPDIDMAVSWLADSQDRKEKFIFSEPYISHKKHKIRVLGNKYLRVDHQQLEGFVIGIIDGTIHKHFLKQTYRDRLFVKSFTNIKQLTKALNTGTVDIALLHEGYTQKLLQDAPLIGQVADPFTHQVNTCIALKKGHYLLKEKVDEFLYNTRITGFLDQLTENFLSSN